MILNDVNEQIYNLSFDFLRKTYNLTGLKETNHQYGNGSCWEVDNKTDILIYQTEDGNTKIDVKLENGTVWMTQEAIAELHQKGVNTICAH